jgi:hypothetical protein
VSGERDFVSKIMVCALAAANSPWRATCRVLHLDLSTDSAVVVQDHVLQEGH